MTKTLALRTIWQFFQLQWLIFHSSPRLFAAVSTNGQKTAVLKWRGNPLWRTIYGQRVAELPSRGANKNE